MKQKNKKTDDHIPDTIPSQRHPLIHTFIQQNSQINLSAIRKPDDIYNKHILDSLELCKVIDIPTLLKTQQYSSTKNPFVLDLWTWWWFPLLPLALTYPKIPFVWLDARKKKCHAINSMIAELGIKNVSTHRGRAEDYSKQATIVTARAVAYADKLISRALPVIKPWGYLILYKLFTIAEDNTILSLMRQYTLRLHKLHHYHLPNDETQRVLYIFEKRE